MAANSKNTTTKSNNPQNIAGVAPDKITTGNVVINKNDGSTQVIKDAPLYQGSFYDPETGDIMGDTHGPDGIYDKETWNKNYYRDENGIATGIFTEKPEKKQTSSSDSSDNDYYSEPSPPQTPSKIEWNEPFPTFSSDYKTIKRYIYHLGLDEAVFSNVVHEENSVCITPSIAVGALGTEEYLMLEADFKGSVEFYIIDGDKTIDILPVGQTKIENEKMFFGLLPRFIVDDQYDVVVKHNTIAINENYQDILSNKEYWVNDVAYTMTYVPITQNTYRPTEEYVQLKIVLRGISSVSHLAFRYYADNYYIN